MVACGALGQIIQGDVAEGGEELLRRGRDLEDLHEELHADRLEEALLDQRPGARHLGGRLLEWHGLHRACVGAIEESGEALLLLDGEIPHSML